MLRVGGGASDGLSFDRGGWGLGRIVTFLNASHDGTGMNSCSCKGQSYTQWTFLAVIYICKWWWLLLLICYRETNAKVATDSEREELEIKLQNAELLAKKRDDEVNSYRKEVRVSTPFDWVFFNQNQNNHRNHWIDHKNNFLWFTGAINDRFLTKQGASCILVVLLSSVIIVSVVSDDKSRKLIVM